MANTVKKLAIVSIIMGIFKIGEEGKLINFFTRIIRTLTQEIVDLKHNITGIKLETKHTMAKLKDQLEDAKNALQDVYTNVNIDALATNAAQEKYMEEYLSSLSEAEKVITSLEDKIKEVAKLTDEAIAQEEAQIKLREARIKTIENYK